MNINLTYLFMILPVLLPYQFVVVYVQVNGQTLGQALNISWETPFGIIPGNDGTRYLQKKTIFIYLHIYVITESFTHKIA